MHLVPNETSDTLVLAFGAEEGLVLLQPGQMLRTVLDANEAWNSAARFLTSAAGAPGMLAVLPRAAASAILAAPARHAIERELKELLFGELSKTERPTFSVLSQQP